MFGNNRSFSHVFFFFSVKIKLNIIRRDTINQLKRRPDFICPMKSILIIVFNDFRENRAFGVFNFVGCFPCLVNEKPSRVVIDFISLQPI